MQALLSAIIVAACTAWAARRVWHALRTPKGGCEGCACEGCALSEELKRQCKKRHS